MRPAAQSSVRTLGLFEPRFAGDDCLMKLASERFRAAGMGAEMHAATPEQLEWVMRFRPWSDAAVVLHLPRSFKLLEHQGQIGAFAHQFAGRLLGMVLHDDPAMIGQRHEYIEAARRMNSQLEKIEHSPLLFIEYAAGLDPSEFADFFASVADLGCVSACLDIGHIGIRAARTAYARPHAGQDLCALKEQNPGLLELMPAVEAAVASGAAAAVDLVKTIASLKKRFHFHLHDGHPLSTFSPFGVSDHLSFYAEIPLNFEYRGRRAVATMFGPTGLAKVVKAALETMEGPGLSLTLEIHPTFERLPLGDAALMFAHWTDKTNAEQMHHWLGLLSRNHSLLLQVVREVLGLGQETTVYEP